MKISEKELIIGRRNALKMVGLGAGAMLTAGFNSCALGPERTIEKMFPRVNIKPIFKDSISPVAFTTGTDRVQMINEVMKPFQSELKAAIKNKKVVLKINMVVSNTYLCATHKDALRGVMEFMRPFYKGEFIVAESTSNGDATVGFENYGYLDLADEYNVKFYDVDQEDKTGNPCYVLNSNLYLEKIGLAKILTDPDYFVINVSRMKTHNAVVMTGSIKNLAMGAPIRNGINVDTGEPLNSKRIVHNGANPRIVHYNLFLVNQMSRPDFAVIDGVETMEGNGPISGTPVDHKIALAGFDGVAVDSMCTRLMGIPMEQVGYLNYCAAAGLGNVDRDKIEIIGSQVPENHIINYAMNPNIESQLRWMDVPFMQVPRGYQIIEAPTPPAGTGQMPFGPPR